MPAFTVCRKSVITSASGRYGRCLLWALLAYVSAHELCKMVAVVGVAVFVGAYLAINLQSKNSFHPPRFLSAVYFRRARSERGQRPTPCDMTAARAGRPDVSPGGEPDQNALESGYRVCDLSH